MAEPIAGSSRCIKSISKPMDYEIQHAARLCQTTGRELAPGEVYYSALVESGAELTRQDFCVEAWQGPPPDSVGWWKSQRPEAGKRPSAGALNDLMLDLFDQCEHKPEQADMRYVLALLLVRRRVLRAEEDTQDAQGREILVLYCPRRDVTYQIAAVSPDDTRIQQIQDELTRLLD
jgi:hypothetical protein